MKHLPKVLMPVLMSLSVAFAQNPQTTAPNPLVTHRKAPYPGTAQPPSATTPQVPQPEAPKVQVQVKTAGQKTTTPPPPIPETPSPTPVSTVEPKIAASAPRISYQNGELTVVAENSGFAEVLSGIRAAL